METPVKKLYGSLFSPATLKVLTCLIEHDLEYEFIPIDLRAGEHKKQPFLSLNPFGEVPAYEDGEFKYFESGAICRSMSFQYGKKGQELIRRDLRAQGLVALWIDVEGHHFEPVARKIVIELVFKPMTGLTPDEAVAAKAEEKLAKVLDIYEAQLTKFKYLSSDTFSIADLIHLPNLQYLMGTSAKKIIESRPRVCAWYKEMAARPSWVKVMEMQQNAKF